MRAAVALAIGVVLLAIIFMARRATAAPSVTKPVDPNAADKIKMLAGYAKSGETAHVAFHAVEPIIDWEFKPNVEYAAFSAWLPFGFTYARAQSWMEDAGETRDREVRDAALAKLRAAFPTSAANMLVGFPYPDFTFQDERYWQTAASLLGKSEAELRDDLKKDRDNKLLAAVLSKTESDFNPAFEAAKAGARSRYIDWSGDKAASGAGAYATSIGTGAATGAASGAAVGGPAAPITAAAGAIIGAAAGWWKSSATSKANQEAAEAAAIASWDALQKAGAV